MFRKKLIEINKELNDYNSENSRLKSSDRNIIVLVWDIIDKVAEILIGFHRHNHDRDFTISFRLSTIAISLALIAIALAIIAIFI